MRQPRRIKAGPHQQQRTHLCPLSPSYCLLCSDLSSRRWVVKGGEDVRLDERLMALWDVMNGLAQHDPGGGLVHWRRALCDGPPTRTCPLPSALQVSSAPSVPSTSNHPCLPPHPCPPPHPCAPPIPALPRSLRAPLPAADHLRRGAPDALPGAAAVRAGNTAAAGKGWSRGSMLRVHNRDAVLWLWPNSMSCNKQVPLHLRSSIPGAKCTCSCVCFPPRACPIVLHRQDAMLDSPQLVVPHGPTVNPMHTRPH